MSIRNDLAVHEYLDANGWCLTNVEGMKSEGSGTKFIAVHAWTFKPEFNPGSFIYDEIFMGIAPLKVGREGYRNCKTDPDHFNDLLPALERSIPLLLGLLISGWGWFNSRNNPRFLSPVSLFSRDSSSSPGVGGFLFRGPLPDLGRLGLLFALFI